MNTRRAAIGRNAGKEVPALDRGHCKTIEGSVLRVPALSKAGTRRAKLAAISQQAPPKAGRLGIFAVILLVLSAGALSACTQQMADQHRYDPLEPSSFFQDGRSARPLPAGTVARGHLREDALLYAGVLDGQPAAVFPFAVTRSVLERGRERYDIFCSPCHDRAGTGNGMVVLRGFERFPVSFHEERMKQAPPGYLFQVITDGFGLMNDYAAQIRPEDRWAIVAYIRALQLSQDADAADLSEEDLMQLDRAPR